LEIGIDVKPGNILIDIDDVESVVASHLKQSPQNTPMHVTASDLRSEALAATDADSMANINVRIVDFGVGEWPSNAWIFSKRN
jgi:serine/threonine protein kinase